MTSKRRTYWHLEGLRRIPTDYEVTTSRLLYTAEHGVAVRTPVVDWYERYQRGSALSVEDWERYGDPLQTTYARYVARQAERESFVESLFRSIDGTDYDRRLDLEWVELLNSSLPVLRYPCHGLQMVSAYLGQLAPAGRIAVTSLFQAGDEMRRIQRFAFRMRQLQATYPEFGASSKRSWLEHPAWQPLREAIERLLVTYDFGEALVALHLVLKPAFDQVFLTGFAALADNRGDPVLGKVLFSLAEDARWHRDWSEALVDYAVLASESNARIVSQWIDEWREPVRRAVSALSELEGSRGAFFPAIAKAISQLRDSNAPAAGASRAAVLEPTA